MWLHCKSVSLEKKSQDAKEQRAFDRCRVITIINLELPNGQKNPYTLPIIYLQHTFSCRTFKLGDTLFSLYSWVQKY